MKKLALILSITILCSVSVASPSYAIFGLSHCEKIKNSIKNIESSFKTSMAGIKAYKGSLSDINGNVDDYYILTNSSEKIYLKLTTELYPVESVWKLAFNNPQCLTRTQNLEIANRAKKNVTTNDYVFASSYNWFKPTQECTGPLKKNTVLTLNDRLAHRDSPVPFDCRLTANNWVVTRFNTYKSIFDF